MKNFVLVSAMVFGFALSAHAEPTGCNGWGAYCTDFSGSGPQHAGADLRMCDKNVLMVNGKEYDPTGLESWRSADGNTVHSGNSLQNVQFVFNGPDGDWTGVCSMQD